MQRPGDHDDDDDDDDKELVQQLEDWEIESGIENENLITMQNLIQDRIRIITRIYRVTFSPTEEAYLIIDISRHIEDEQFDEVDYAKPDDDPDAYDLAAFLAETDDFIQQTIDTYVLQEVRSMAGNGEGAGAIRGMVLPTIRRGAWSTSPTLPAAAVWRSDQSRSLSDSSPPSQKTDLISVNRKIKTLRSAAAMIKQDLTKLRRRRQSYHQHHTNE